MRGAEGFRGIEIVLQHAPEDTGFAVWVYTAYSHFERMPTVELGQRIRMGEPLGPTGKTIPVEGHYADVVALMRRQMPLDSHSMRALPEAEKRVRIPYKLTTGEIIPPDTKIIWPYACAPRR